MFGFYIDFYSFAPLQTTETPTSVGNLPRRLSLHLGWDGDTPACILVSGGGFVVPANSCFQPLYFKVE